MLICREEKVTQTTKRTKAKCSQSKRQANQINFAKYVLMQAKHRQTIQRILFAIALAAMSYVPSY